MNKTSIIVPVTGTADISTKSVGECLKSTQNFNETIYINVCNGKSYSVPLGFWDMAGNIGLVLFIGGIGIAAFVMVLKIMFD